MSDLLSRQSWIESFFPEHRYNLSAFSVVNLFAWEDFFHFEFVVMDECLCVFAHQEAGCFQYWPPLGQNVTREVILKCFAHMHGINGSSGLSRIENVPQELLEVFDPKDFRREKRADEYCYDRRALAELAGADYRSHRWACNHFTERHAWMFGALKPDHLSACAELYEIWAAHRLAHNPDEMFQAMIHENRDVHRKMLENAGRLNLTACGLFFDGRLAAYTAGYPLNERVFCDLLEVADPQIKGAAAVVFRELCRDEAVARYHIINAMDDFGLPNVQRTKMSYHPQSLIPSYTVTLR